MKLEYGAQSELRCRHHRVTNSFTFTFPSLYHSPMAGRKMQENARRKKSRKRHNTVVARKCSTFFSLLFFASLWLSALCFSWQIASDIKFIYAKFARRALSYCPSTKRKTHSTPSTTVHITQGIQYTQCVAYNTPVLAHNCSPAVGVGGGGVTAAAAAACDTLDKHRMVIFENFSSDSRMI